MREKTALVPDTPTNPSELISELRDLTERLNVRQRLDVYGRTLSTLSEQTTGKAHYYLLKLEPLQQKVTVTGFRQAQLEDAAGAYLEAERAIANNPGAEAVLVSVSSMSALRQAYPNYFLDTRHFLSALEETMQG